MKRYEAYKDSGVDWIGEIPVGWECKRLGALLTVFSSKNHTDKPLLSITREKGVILRDLDDETENHNFIPDDLSGYKLIKEGQFGMNKMKAWQGSYGISDYDGIVSPAYFIFNVSEEIYPNFFHLAIRSKFYVAHFGSASDGVRIGQWDLSKPRMREIPFFIPPLPEQTDIAEFLDNKTAKIDQLIGIKQKEIELLKERRQILIQQAVTKGLDATVPMKDSGVEWIGEIPEHWEVRKLKYCLSSKLKYGANESGVEYDASLPRYIRITDFGFDGNLSEEKKLSLTWEQGKDYLLKDGDILFARSGATVGKSYQFKTSMSLEKNYSFAGYLIKAEADEKIIHSDYLYLYTNSNLFDNWKSTIFNKATIENIGADKYSTLNVVVPPIKEQEEILVEYNLKNEKISKAISVKEQEIEKLKEYKTVLIDNVVTGKVKINL